MPVKVHLIILDPIKVAISNYKNHPSINAIRGNMQKLM